MFQRGKKKNKEAQGGALSHKTMVNDLPFILYILYIKTKLSQRTPKFPRQTMKLLKELREYRNGEALKSGDRCVESDRLFTKENGEPQHPNNTYHWLERFCKKIDFF